LKTASIVGIILLTAYLYLLNSSPVHCQDLKPDLVVQTGHSSPPNSVAFSPDKSILASGSPDGTVRLWDISTGLLLKVLQEENSVDQVAFDPDGRFVADATSYSYHFINKGSVSLWSTDTWTKYLSFAGTEFALFPKENAIAVASQGDWKNVLSNGLWTTESAPEITMYSLTTDKAIWSFQPPSTNVLRYLSLAADPAGRFLAAGDNVGNVGVWNSLDGKRIGTLKGFQGSVNSLVFSPSGRYLAGAGEDETIRLWDIGTLHPVRTIDVNDGDPLYNISFCGSDDLIVSAARNWVTVKRTLKFWNVKTGDEVLDNTAPPPANASILPGSGVQSTDVPPGKKPFLYSSGSNFRELASVSPDGKLLERNGWDDGSIWLWDRPSAALMRVFPGNGSSITTIRFLPDNQTLCCGIWSIDEKAEGLCYWNSHTGQLTRSEPKQMGLNFSLSQDGTKVVEAMDPFISKRLVHVCDLATGKEDASTSGMMPYALSNDDNTLACAILANRQFKNRFSILNLQTNTQNELDLDQPADSLTFSPDDNRLACVMNTDNVVKIYDTRDLTKSLSLKGTTTRQVTALAFSPDGGTIATGLESSLEPNQTVPVGWNLPFPINGAEVDLWDSHQGTIIRRIVLEAGADGVLSLCFSHKGDVLACAYTDNSVRLWNVHDGSLKIKLAMAHTASSLTFSANDDRLAVISADNTVQLWDIPTGKRLVTFIARPAKESGNYDWVTYTDAGFYTGSRDAFRAVAFRLGDHVYPYDQFDVRFNRPDQVMNALGCPDQDLIKYYKAAYLKRLDRMGYSEPQVESDAFHLPVLALTGSAPPLTTSARTFTFGIRATDDREALDLLKVLVNDVPANFTFNDKAGSGSNGLSLRNQNQNTAIGNIALELSSGVNKIQVSVLNSHGAESLRQTFNITCTVPAALHDIYIVSVGVSEYQANSGLKQLGSAAEDAQAVSDFFNESSNFYAHPPHIWLLKNADATKEKILESRYLLMQSKVDDEVIVFFAGHGLLDAHKDDTYYFCTPDISVDHPEARGLPYDQIEGLLDGIPARDKLLMMDTCHAGEVDPTTTTVTDALAQPEKRGSEIVNTVSGLDNAFDLQQDIFADLRMGTGATVIAASRGEESALETNKHGYFTQAVLAALWSHPSPTVSQLRDAVAAQVVEETKNDQHPVMRSVNLSDDFQVVPEP